LRTGSRIATRALPLKQVSPFGEGAQPDRGVAGDTFSVRRLAGGERERSRGACLLVLLAGLLVVAAPLPAASAGVPDLVAAGATETVGSATDATSRVVTDARTVVAGHADAAGQAVREVSSGGLSRVPAPVAETVQQVTAAPANVIAPAADSAPAHHPTTAAHKVRAGAAARRRRAHPETLRAAHHASAPAPAATAPRPAIALHAAHPGAVATPAACCDTAPAPERAPTGTGPGGAAAAAAPAGAAALAVGLLVLWFALAAPRSGRRLRLRTDLRLPPAVLRAIERPG
jgi:hypothetical protein